MDKIIIKGAREHNLKNIDVEIPRNQMVVITGRSGSGKSSLAFDTIYAEGQRRYVESLSVYARQFLEQMDKPDLDYIEGLSPAIAIQQRALSHNPRSTVGTTTEIYDYMRLLFARIGKPFCPNCGLPIQPQTAQQIISQINKLPFGAKVQILAPLVQGRKGEYRELLERVRKEGYLRIRIDGQQYSLEEEIKLDKNKKHDILILLDRIEVAPESKSRIADSVETALKLGQGLVIVNVNAQDMVYSEHYACHKCGISLPEITPRFFSFNAPHGACPECTGLGNKIEVDPDLVIPDKDLSIFNGALVPWSQPITTKRHRWKGAWSSWYFDLLAGVSKKYGIALETPFKKLSPEKQDIILYGDGAGTFEGVITNLQRRYKETESDYVREEIYQKYMMTRPCPVCRGARLRKEALSVKIGNKSIADMVLLSSQQSMEFFNTLSLNDKEQKISRQILKEIKARLKFLLDVGLDYITLDRETSTLAGGEAQRIQLATQIGSGLVGVLYVLDEPTIGLHARDTNRLLRSLEELKKLGNTVLIVEHDVETINKADYILDLGPGAGEHGGRIVCQGTLKDILACDASSTGKYLSGKIKIPIPPERRQPDNRYLEIIGASHFNLKNIDVKIPLGLFVCVTGVSGSGKSTLVNEIIYKALAQKLGKAKEKPGKFNSIKGLNLIDKVIMVDQSPIGRTPRSNPATYTGVFTPVRELFSQLPESRVRGYEPGRFSFNVKGGRCETCQGDGVIKIEMQFLPNVYIKCEECKGARFNHETLEIRFKGKNIAEILDLTVEEACSFFQNIPAIHRPLQSLFDVGLGYIKVGQSATTLSGGEAQRVKLASELGKRSTGQTIYILDEPTTGLHFADIHNLLEVLHRLTAKGNTILIIEHNLDVVKTADHIIDLGPAGGEAGGHLIAAGTPEEVSQMSHSYTGQYLKRFLVASR
ncbi:MAG: excinuclease ABC subunit UvrA [Elusimicrobia bacterium]|nr:excinuclease ABC subunit UvrA [Elusimicrobiota bacterium]